MSIKVEHWLIISTGKSIVCDYLARWLLNDHLLDLGIKMGNHPHTCRQASTHTHTNTYIRKQSTNRRAYHTQHNFEYTHTQTCTVHTHKHAHARTQIVVLTFSCMFFGLFLFLCLLNRYFYAINKVGSHNTCVSLSLHVFLWHMREQYMRRRKSTSTYTRCWS